MQERCGADEVAGARVFRILGEASPKYLEPGGGVRPPRSRACWDARSHMVTGAASSSRWVVRGRLEAARSMCPALA